jgi:hypothetical protein
MVQQRMNHNSGSATQIEIASLPHSIRDLSFSIQFMSSLHIQGKMKSHLCLDYLLRKPVGAFRQLRRRLMIVGTTTD